MWGLGNTLSFKNWQLRFFFQGVHAWTHFAGLPLDQAALRAALLASEETA